MAVTFSTSDSMPFARSALAATIGSAGRNVPVSGMLHGFGHGGEAVSEEEVGRQIRETAAKLWGASGELLKQLVQMLLNFRHAIVRFFQPASREAQGPDGAAPAAPSTGTATAPSSARNGKRATEHSMAGDPAMAPGTSNLTNVASDMSDMSDMSDGFSERGEDDGRDTLPGTVIGTGFKRVAALGALGASPGVSVPAFVQAVHDQEPSAEDLLAASDPAALVRAFVTSQATVLRDRQLDEVSCARFLEEDVAHLAYELELEPDAAIARVLANPALNGSLSDRVRTQHETLVTHRKAVATYRDLIVHALVVAKSAGVNIESLEVDDVLAPLLPDWLERVTVLIASNTQAEAATVAHARADAVVAATPVAMSPVAPGDRASFAIESDVIELPADNLQRGSISRLRAAIDQHRPEDMHDERPAA